MCSEMCVCVCVCMGVWVGVCYCEHAMSFFEVNAFLYGWISKLANLIC